MRALFLSTIAAIAIVACSPPASTTGEAPGQETAVSGAAPAAGAQMRTGRWSKVMTVMGQQTTQVECVTTTDVNQMASEPNSQCTSPNGFQRTSEGLVYEADCTGEDGGGHLRTVLNGDLQNHYVVDMTMSAPSMPNGMQIHIEGTYEGACRGDE